MAPVPKPTLAQALALFLAAAAGLTGGVVITKPPPAEPASQCIMAVGSFESGQFSNDSLFLIDTTGTIRSALGKITVSTTAKVPAQYVNRNVQFCTAGKLLTSASYGCPDSLPGALVVHFADASDTGVVSRADIRPVVLCGSQQIAKQMDTYVKWVNAGPCPCRNGPVNDTVSNPYSKVVLSPSDTVDSLRYSPVSLLVQSDSLRWSIPANIKVSWKTLGGVLYTVLAQAKVPGKIGTDTVSPPREWWSYVPFQGGVMLRTGLSAAADTSSVLNIRLTRFSMDGIS